MKILPDYMIQYMPEIEAAAEELRLSVMDHAYEMLKCLDIDELTSEDIRKKLELYDIKVENMSESWLPNGRFYRIYPSIKHNRTTYQAIQSIVKSGGQFEGLWSYDFSDKPEYNYRKLQLLRHYELKLSDDGYFFISGDALQDIYGRSTDAALVALSSDILLYQALPAGYTYLYIPWPRPHYPTDSNYFYNVHTLDYDRLHYPQYSAGEYVIYDTSRPAFLNYYKEDEYYTHTPYWLDYHYSGTGLYLTPESMMPNDKWPIRETGSYRDKDDLPCDYTEAVSFKLDEECEELGYSNAVFPTNFYIRERLASSAPDIHQTFTPLELDSSGNPTIQYTIDESKLVGDTNFTSSSAYRFDLLAKDYHLKIRESILNIKSFKPIWCEESPIFDMMQSTSTSQSDSNRSLLYWTLIGQRGNIPHLTESTIEYNKPDIADITCTTVHRPTISRLDPIYIGFLLSKNNNQDNNKYLYPGSIYNSIYEYDSNLAIKYDPELYYTIVGASRKSSDGSQIDFNSDILSIEGDPSTNSLYIKNNSSSNVFINYITYKTSRIYKLWFSSDKSDVLLNTRIFLFNRFGDNNIYRYSENSVNIKCNRIIGVFDSNDNKVECDNPNVTCFIKVDENTNRYVFSSNVTAKDGIPVRASYILFTVEVTPGQLNVEDITDIEHTNYTIFDAQTFERTSLGTIEYVDYSRSDYFILDRDTDEVLFKSRNNVTIISPQLSVIDDDEGVNTFDPNISVIQSDPIIIIEDNT